MKSILKRFLHVAINVRDVERLHLLSSFFACGLFLVILFLWYTLYQFSCLALILPMLMYLAIFYGGLESLLERKNFVLDYYLRRDSSFRQCFQRKRLAVVFCLIVSVPLAWLLMASVVISRPIDWLFFGFVALSYPVVFNILAMRLGKHVRKEVENVFAKNISGMLVFVVIAIAYSFTNYYLVPVPGDKIFPNSLEKTLEAFRADAGSQCSRIEDMFLVAAEVEGLSWYLMITASSFLASNLIELLLWAVFFFHAATVYFGFVQGLGGSILLTIRTIEKYRKPETGIRD